MNIQSINITNRNNYNPSFGDCAMRAVNENLIRHYTFVGRNFDFDREKIADYVIKLMKENKLSQFVFCGCSDGSEVFDIMMAVVKRFTENNIPLDKLPEFKAFDVSEYLIEKASKGRINLTEYGVNYVQKTYPNYNFFLDKGELIKHPNDDLDAIRKRIGAINNSYRFNRHLLDKINFYPGDMLSEFKKLNNDKCTILFCRNVSQYLTENEQRAAAEALNKNLKEGSLVIVDKGDECRQFCDRPVNDVWKDYNRLPFCDELNYTNGRGRFCHDKNFAPSPITIVYRKANNIYTL